MADDEVIIVSEETARSLSAVFACLEIKSQDFAQLPKGVYSKMDGKTTHHVEHPTNNLINFKPNTYQTAYDFWHQIIQDRDSYGKAFAIIERDERSNAIGLHRKPPWEFKKVTQSDSGAIKYEFRDASYDYIDVLHLRASPDGMSPLRRNQQTISLAKRQENYATDITGKRPPAVLSTDMPMKKEQVEDLMDSWHKHISAGKIPVLPHGIKHIPTTLPPGDIDLIQAMELTARQIYSIYRIPPTMAGDYSNSPYASAEHQDITYVKYGLMPGIVQAEQEIKVKLLNRKKDADKYIKINVNALLRGDIDTRTAHYQAMISTGVYSPNMVLEMEDKDSYEGGDQRFIQSAFIPVDMARDFWEGRSGSDSNPPVSNSVGTHREKIKKMLRANIKDRKNGKHKVQGSDI